MKLKPCHWCGKKPRLWDEEDPYYPGGPVVVDYYIECADCRLKMYGGDKEALIRKWNKEKI